MNAARALLYFHTLRSLRATQVLGRVWRGLRRPAIDDSPAPELRPVAADWTEPARLEASWCSPTRRAFLGVEREVDSPGAWSDETCSRLWLYNLHYFDDLVARDAEERAAWHRAEVARWIAQNPPAEGPGWEPYPTSLRIVNWVRWRLAGEELPAVVRHSLAVQARYLRENLEHHLLGNHLLANAKALVFAGATFRGREAEGWLRQGLAILRRELREQVLSDGGHFERSPMYHSIVLADLLDLLNLFATYGGELPPACHAAAEEWKRVAQAMRRWLAAMCHPDGEIALFNDAAFGVAPAPAELEGYARRLGLGPSPLPHAGALHLASSGYLRLELGEALAFLDVGEIGPSYLPGHAHADSLGFELSLGGKRFLVDSGTSLYEEGPERLRQRGTAAHNTVEVDGVDSSEVWASFRVARRAAPHGLEIDESPDGFEIACGHDGYLRLPGRVYHQRRWRLEAGALHVLDRLEGRFKRATARYHLHPTVEKPGPGVLRLPDFGAVSFEGEPLPPVLEPTTWHPRFGSAEPSSRLAFPFSEPSLRTTFRW